jgi:hypothetical protein
MLAARAQAESVLTWLESQRGNLTAEAERTAAAMALAGVGAVPGVAPAASPTAAAAGAGNWAEVGRCRLTLSNQR